MKKMTLYMCENPQYETVQAPHCEHRARECGRVIAAEITPVAYKAEKQRQTCLLFVNSDLLNAGLAGGDGPKSPLWIWC
jgi:hypothetical protein